ncbi:MAG TPA: transglutaminase-like domain-containing protein [Gemmatimonadaceae bacterium]
MPAQFARRGQVRLLAAVLILGAWAAGLTALVRREFFQGRPQRLAEAALRLSPSATYFAVEKSGAVIGFASTTIDTVANGIDAIDYSVADLPAATGTGTERTSKRSVVKLSRALTFRSFETEVDSRSAPARTAGRADGDTAIVYVRGDEKEPADSQRVSVSGPVILPPVVPIAIALGEQPRVGRTYSLPTFDPATMTSAAAEFRIDAESLFTLVDSARFDQDKGEWVAALSDTVRGWHVTRSGPTDGASEWVDAQGRVVQAVQPGGLTLRRTAYELAFENWRIARDRATATSAGTEDIQERTAIAAGAKVGRSKLFAMTVKLGAPRFAGYDLDGGRQHFSGDTLTVVREKDTAIGAGEPTIGEMHQPPFKQRFRTELAAEPTLQVHDGEIVMLAIRIVGLDRAPHVMVQKINQWVHDSVANVATFSVPNAVAIARSRRGDCNEHTQLLVALVRAIGVPARFASGLLYVNGKFYYHAWPEVWLGQWVAVDPTFGQFPADAAHLRFVLGGQSRQAELLQLMGNLTIKVLEAK